MVPDGEGHCKRDLSSGKGHPSEGPGVDFRMKRTILCLLCLLWFLPSSFAQVIYAENQIPARGVEIEYTVGIKNPISHLYDVEISIKGIRETSVSVSMPAWSPGMYRIEN